VFGFINGINLAFHEGGHAIFGVLRIPFVTVLGGTLMQLALPAAAFFHFYSRKPNFAGALMLLWFGQNFLGIGNYMQDAMVQQLPLIGDGTHDWTYLFDALGITRFCVGIGGFTKFAGWVIMAISMVWIITAGISKIQEERALRRSL